MAFSPDTPNLWLEVKAAVKESENHVEPTHDMMRRLTGRFYRKDADGIDAQPENFGYAFISNILPMLATENPAIQIKAARVIGHQEISDAMNDGLEAWLEDVMFAERLGPVLFDFCMIRGVVMHRLEPEKRFSRGQVRPNYFRLNPIQFFIDPFEDTNRARYMGHWYYADFDDLQADPLINQDVLARLSPGAGDPGGRGKESAYAKPDAGTLGRKRVKCYSVWIRERNELRVLAEGVEDAELYPPRTFFGPESGPYKVFDAVPVPGESWPLSPLVAVEDQVRDLNVHAVALGRSQARRKSVGLVEASNLDLGEKLVDAEDGEIIPVKGITGNYVEAKVGGADATQYTHTEYVRARLDRISGLTATVQGAVGDANTATEAQIASNALSSRVRWLKTQVQRAISSLLHAIGWYLFHTEGIVIPVSRRDRLTGQLSEGVFFGGPSPTDQGAMWDDFNIRVRLVNRGDPAEQQQFTAYYQMFLNVMQAALTIPGLRFMNILHDLDQAFECDRAEEWILPEMFGMMSSGPMMPPSALIGGQQIGQQPGAGGPPNMARQSLMAGPMPAGGQQQAGQVNRNGQTTGPQGGGQRFGQQPTRAA